MGNAEQRGDSIHSRLSKRLGRVGSHRFAFIARPGGDEFAIFSQSSHEYGSVAAMDARIRVELERPVIVQDRALCPSCSIGVTVRPTDGLQFEALLEQADRSMYAQKLGHRPRPAARHADPARQGASFGAN